MDNGGFENEKEVNHSNNCSHTDIHATAPEAHGPEEPEIEHEANCACVESQTQCQCNPAQPNRKIEARAWVKPKGWMLLGMAVALVAWTAIFFTLVGLGYV